MSLPVCPSCGQSVLEDNAVDCPFCGAAMDGSRGAKYTPRAKTNPAASRPGARKLPEKPAAPSVPSSPAETPKPIARPAGAAKNSKAMVDEDDPFGIGQVNAGAQAIQASAKPEKGRLYKVVCPMCEQVGFIPKSAVGKSIRCANQQCMVPVFIANDPSEPPSERRPARMSDAADAAGKATLSTKPVKRNPLIIYGIVGGILLVVTLALVPLLKRKPDASQFDKPVVLKDFGPDDDELQRQEAEKLARAKAAADAANPMTEVQGHVKRMISLARQPNLRDKAWARRMTGDLYLRLSDTALAAQEFNQLLVVDSNSGLYRMDPHVTRYWRAIAVADAGTAKKALDDAMAELPSLRKTPGTGRTATESALGLAAALVNEGRKEEAVQLVASRQLDRTIPHNRDAIIRMAWGFAADRARDAGVESPAVLDAVFWTDPLQTAVAIDLAIHGRWNQAIDWAKTSRDNRTISDSLVAMAEIAESTKPGAEVMTALDAAISPSDIVSSLRVRAAVAAAVKDPARMDQCLALVEKLSAGVPVIVPSSNDMIQNDIPDRSQFLKQALALAEVIRACVRLNRAEQASDVLTRLLSDLSAAAPPTAVLRELTNQITNAEAAFRKRLGSELRVTVDSQLDSMFRRYRRRLEQLATDAEDRRLLEILLFARIVRAGGAAIVEQAVNQPTELRRELLLDELSGLIAVSARKTGQELPTFFSPEAALRNGRARYGKSELIVEIARVADAAWATREQNPGDCLTALESKAGTALPGLRQALVCELVDSMAKSCKDPATVLNAISKMQNGVWREEAYVIAGEIFADRKIDAKVSAWIAETRIPAMEQITLWYGISLGILERPVPGVAAPTDSTPAAGTGAG